MPLGAWGATPAAVYQNTTSCFLVHLIHLKGRGPSTSAEAHCPRRVRHSISTSYFLGADRVRSFILPTVAGGASLPSSLSFEDAGRSCVVEVRIDGPRDPAGTGCVSRSPEAVTAETSFLRPLAEKVRESRQDSGKRPARKFCTKTNPCILGFPTPASDPEPVLRLPSKNRLPLPRVCPRAWPVPLLCGWPSLRNPSENYKT
jgi:hypothetical protein